MLRYREPRQPLLLNSVSNELIKPSAPDDHHGNTHGFTSMIIPRSLIWGVSSSTVGYTLSSLFRPSTKLSGSALVGRAGYSVGKVLIHA
jgi:hypothetical protein